jgi:hypothetical protein
MGESRAACFARSFTGASWAASVTRRAPFQAGRERERRRVATHWSGKGRDLDSGISGQTLLRLGLASRFLKRPRWSHLFAFRERAYHCHAVSTILSNDE